MFYLSSLDNKLSLLYEKKEYWSFPHLPSLLGLHTLFYLFSEEEKSPVSKELLLAFACLKLTTLCFNKCIAAPAIPLSCTVP